MKFSSLFVCAALLVSAGAHARQNPRKPAATEGGSAQRPGQTQPRPTPAPQRKAEDESFLLAVEDVFAISGRGTVVTGRVERGKVKVNDAVEIVGARPTKQAVVTGVEAFRKMLDEAGPGDSVGLLLSGVGRDEVERGQVIAKPGSIRAHAKFKARVDMLPAEEGGRRTPFFDGYRPQFYFRTRDVTGVAKLPAGRESVAPGDQKVELSVELVSPVALEKGLRFAVREGGRTVGAGVVTEIVE